MMNDAFRRVIGASDDDRRDLFLTTARRLGTAVQNVEKDFWVCWILDALFNGISDGSPRLLFKGGTSLSKSFGLIARFSEDIDITVFRSDLGESVSVEELEALSGKKRRAKLEAIKAACQGFIAGPLLRQLATLTAHAMTAGPISDDRYRLELDAEDVNQQTVLFWYPAVTDTTRDDVRSAVKIEAGAKSALDPNIATSVRPYAADDLPDLDLTVRGITTVEAQRTFWDKVVILHGLRRWHDHRGQLRHGGQRVSRHYYDVFRLLSSSIGEVAQANRQLGVDCARHARMFFNSPDFDLDDAVSGRLSLTPSALMRDPLERDYAADLLRRGARDEGLCAAGTGAVGTRPVPVPAAPDAADGHAEALSRRARSFRIPGAGCGCHRVHTGRRGRAAPPGRRRAARAHGWSAAGDERGSQRDARRGRDALACGGTGGNWAGNPDNVVQRLTETLTDANGPRFYDLSFQAAGHVAGVCSACRGHSRSE